MNLNKTFFSICFITYFVSCQESTPRSDMRSINAKRENTQDARRSVMNSGSSETSVENNVEEQSGPSLENSAVDCGTGKYLQGFDKSGNPNCVALPTSPLGHTPTVAAPSPTPASTLPTLDLNCGPGKYLQGFDAGGNKLCVAIPSNPMPVVAAPVSPVQPAPVINLKWNLDKDCVAMFPNCQGCSQFTTMTCPADPGGLSCSTQGTYCVTPQGCRRFKCF